MLPKTMNKNLQIVLFGESIVHFIKVVLMNKLSIYLFCNFEEGSCHQARTPLSQQVGSQTM